MPGSVMEGRLIEKLVECERHCAAAVGADSFSDVIHKLKSQQADA